MANKINGYILCKLRENMGYAQEDLADMLGITRQAVQKWESGKSGPNRKRLLELSKIFGVSVDYLLGTSDNYINPADMIVTEQETYAHVDALVPKQPTQIEIAATEQKEEVNKPKIPKAVVIICLIVITSIIAIFSIVLSFSLFTSNQGGYDTAHTFDIINPLVLLFIGLGAVVAILVIITICIALKRKN